MTAASELGPRLRAQRERRGIGVSKAADELRLDAWIVEAMEAGEFDRVGAPVYAKGHLRRYAAMLGLPESEVAATVESLTAPVPAVTPLDPVPFASAPSKRLTELPWGPVAALAAFAIIVIGVLWSKPWRLHVGTPTPVATPPADVSPQANGSPQAGTTAAPVGAPMPAAPATAAPTVMTAAPSTASPEPSEIAARAPVDAANGSRLRLEFAGESWVSVRDATGRLVFRGVARAGTSQTLSGRAPFAIVLGYQRGVKVQVNGRAVRIADSFIQGNVARFQAGADGVSSRYAASPPPRH